MKRILLENNRKMIPLVIILTKNVKRSKMTKRTILVKQEKKFAKILFGAGKGIYQKQIERRGSIMPCPIWRPPDNSR